jgi:ribonuclease D
VVLEKGPQRADWSRRPLTERMVAYALNDARYLHELAQALRRRLAELERLEWHVQFCRQALAEATQPVPDRSDEAWRIKSADLLTPRALAYLRALWQWREQEATGANRPPFFVLSHDLLFNLAVAVAQGDPPDQFIPRRYSPRRRERLLDAIRVAEALPESDWPRPRKHRGRRLTTGQKNQLERLRHRRDRAANRLAIDPTLIASRATLVALAADGEQALAELLPWQRDLLTNSPA